MPNLSYKNIRISGISSAVPSEVIDIDSFITSFGEENVQKFKAMTGINQLRRTFNFQTASDLGYVAADHLLCQKGIDRDSVGALIFVSHSPDYKRPATAFILQKRLKIGTECLAFDINLGCSATVYGINAICSLMSSSDIKTGLLIVAETVSKVVNPLDRSTAMLFGDAGSAFLFEKTEDNSTIQSLLRSDGEGYRAIIVPGGGSRNPSPPDTLMRWNDGTEKTLYNTNMNGTDVFNFTISEVPKAIKDFLSINNRTVDYFDSFILHQANHFIIKQIARKVKIPIEKIPISLDRFGNTSGPALPLTICDTYGDKSGGSIKVLMCGFGVGLSWGVLSADIDIDDVFPVIITDTIFSEGIINSPEDM